MNAENNTIRRWKSDRQMYLDWCELKATVQDAQTEATLKLEEMRKNAGVPEGIKVTLIGTHFVEEPE